MAQKLQLFYNQLQIELEVNNLYNFCTFNLAGKNIAKKSDGFHYKNGNFTKKRPIFDKSAEPNFGGKLTERSVEPVWSISAERSAEPFGFGRTLLSSLSMTIEK